MLVESIKGAMNRSANEVNAFNIPLYILVGFLVMTMGMLAGMMFTYQSSANEIGKVAITVAGSLSNAVALCLVYLKRAGHYGDLLENAQEDPSLHEKVPKWSEFRKNSPLNKWAITSSILIVLPLFLLVITFINIDVWKSLSFIPSGLGLSCIIGALVIIVSVHLPAKE